MFCVLLIVRIIVVKQQKTIDYILYIQVINNKSLKKKSDMMVGKEGVESDRDPWRRTI